MVADLEFLQSLGKIDVALGDIYAVQGIEVALVNGTRRYFARHVAPLINDPAGLTILTDRVFDPP